LKAGIRCFEIRLPLLDQGLLVGVRTAGNDVAAHQGRVGLEDVLVVDQPFPEAPDGLFLRDNFEGREILDPAQLDLGILDLRLVEFLVRGKPGFGLVQLSSNRICCATCSAWLWR
jgi:hypothetical protein